jgi:hypothetical protein
MVEYNDVLLPASKVRYQFISGSSYQTNIICICIRSQHSLITHILQIFYMRTNIKQG